MTTLDIEEVLRRTRDRSPRVRREALLELCPCKVRSDLPGVWDRLLEMGRDPEASVRSLVLHSLCDGSPRSRENEVVEAVETMTRDPDRKLRLGDQSAGRDRIC